jgi:hemerythrin
MTSALLKYGITEKFTQSVKTGLPRLDCDHGELLKLLNNALELCETNPTKIKVRDDLDFLIFRLTAHFQDEENIQIKSNYPDYQSHEKEHMALIESLVTLRIAYSRDNITTDELASILSEKMADWIVKHTEKSDVEFGRYYINEHATRVWGIKKKVADFSKYYMPKYTSIT